MPALEIQGIPDDQVRRGLESLNGFSEEGFYRPYVSAGIVGASGAALQRPPSGAAFLDVSAWLLPSASFPNITDTLGLPPGWVVGSLGLRIFYTGSAGSTNTINFSWLLTHVNGGAAIPASTFTASFTAPGPATAGLALSVDVPTLVSVPASAAFAMWKLRRTNPDAYGANDVWIIGVRPLFYPRKG